MMTNDEAAQKTCPMMTGPSDQDGFATDLYWVNCIADSCACWIWDVTLMEGADGDYISVPLREDEKKGHCGLIQLGG